MKRLESLDALRGFDMFFIMGGAAMIAAIAACFPDNSIWNVIGENMEHVPWEGLHHHDTIFPLFLFIAGVSFPFSLEKQRENGKSERSIYLKVVRRGLTLVFFGLLYNGLLGFELSTLRFCSVLSRIGLGWMLGALIFMNTKTVKTRTLIIIAILVFYWLACAFIPVPDAPADADVFSKQWNIGCYLDRVILGAHSYRPEYDPEGLFSTIPAIGTAMLGMLSGCFIKTENAKFTGSRKALYLALAGFCLGIIAWIWNYAFPINKALWSSSFVCAVGCYSLIMLALFYYIIDVRGWKAWDKFFVVIGMNSITIYMAQRFSVISGELRENLFGGFTSLFPELWQPTMVYATWIATCWIFLYFLYKHKIFLKV